MSCSLGVQDQTGRVSLRVAADDQDLLAHFDQGQRACSGRSWTFRCLPCHRTRSDGACRCLLVIKQLWCNGRASIRNPLACRACSKHRAKCHRLQFQPIPVPVASGIVPGTDDREQSAQDRDVHGASVAWFPSGLAGSPAPSRRPPAFVAVRRRSPPVANRPVDRRRASACC